MTYRWQTDFANSYTLAIRFMALQHGSTHFHTLTEMYWLESKGLIP